MTRSGNNQSRARARNEGAREGGERRPPGGPWGQGRDRIALARRVEPAQGLPRSAVMSAGAREARPRRGVAGLGVVSILGCLPPRPNREHCPPARDAPRAVRHPRLEGSPCVLLRGRRGGEVSPGGHGDVDAVPPPLGVQAAAPARLARGAPDPSESLGRAGIGPRRNGGRPGARHPFTGPDSPARSLQSRPRSRHERPGSTRCCPSAGHRCQ